MNQTTLAADNAHDAFRAVRRFGSLDGLRCAAVLMVVWNHAPGWNPSPLTPLLTTHLGVLGVDLFFVISGFLITTLLLRERETNGDISLRNFYARRSLRIFPLYYAILAVYAAATFFLERRPDDPTQFNGAAKLFFQNLPYYLTYTSNWFVDLQLNEDGVRRVIFIFAWSLATEEQFYLFWPLVLKKLGKAAGVGVMVGLIALDQAAHFGLLDALPHRPLVIVESIATPICLGVLSAILVHDRSGYRLAFRVAGQAWSSAFWAACAIAVMVFGAHEQSVDDNPVWRLSLAFLFTLLVLSCVMNERHALARALQFPLARRFGEVSYGVYMMHMIAVHVVGMLFRKLNLEVRLGVDPAPFKFVTVLTTVFLMAEASFRTYERFFLRLKSRFETPRERA